MKKDEEKVQDNFDEFGDVYDWSPEDGYQGRSEDQVNNNARTGGCAFVFFLIILVWWGAYELIKYLS